MSMFCRECGKEVVNQNVMACTHCGVNPRNGKSFCQHCGVKTKDKQIMCTKCGGSLGLSDAYNHFNSLSNKYAGFWKRAAAAFVDSLIIMPLGFLIIGIMHWLDLYNFFLLLDLDYNQYVDPDYYLFYLLPSSLVGIFYFCGMESSSKQATLGKMALGIKVVGMQDEQISFGKALARHFGKWISALCCYIGFIMVGLTHKKQGLHDILASAQVINKNH
tara:strand:- start:30 stop:683 length:654 start_codon:yes stop_codon:yes gene_type:complete